MRKLIGMVDFVLEQSKSINHPKTVNKIIDYSRFLKQTLELWMFVPCDEEGNVLDSLDKFKSCSKGFKYGQAKERCLFEGFELCGDGFIRAEDSYILFSIEGMKKETIEDMIYYQTTLTQTAIKQLGL